MLKYNIVVVPVFHVMGQKVSCKDAEIFLITVITLFPGFLNYASFKLCSNMTVMKIDGNYLTPLYYLNSF